MDPEQNVKPAEPEQNAPAAKPEFEEIVKAAKELRFRNPELAARSVAGEGDFNTGLKELSEREPYMVWPKVTPNNPEVERTAPSLADRLRKALRTRGRRS
jgi:hypothetical protein